MLIVPADAAGRTYASRAPVAPDAALGPVIPAKNTANVTGTVTITAITVEELTVVAIVRSTLPVIARARWASSLSRQLPANDESTRVAKPPKAANVAIWGLAITLSVNANSPHTHTIARTARIAAGTDHFGRRPAISALRLHAPVIRA